MGGMGGMGMEGVRNVSLPLLSLADEISLPQMGGGGGAETLFEPPKSREVLTSSQACGEANATFAVSRTLVGVTSARAAHRQWRHAQPLSDVRRCC